MNKRSEIIKEGMLVTIASFIAVAVAFMLYFLIFTVFETIANQDGSYGFVSYLRVGYGIVWLGLGLIVYRSAIYDWLKASLLTASLTTFMVGIGVQLYGNPVIAYFAVLLVAAISAFLLHKTKQKWYHYYAVVLSIIAALFYL